MPLLFRSVARGHGGPGNVTARKFPDSAGSIADDGADLSIASLCVRKLLSGPASGIRKPATHIQRLQLFLFILRELAPALRALFGPDDSDARTHERVQSRGSCE